LTLELRLPAAEPGKLAACALAVINPPWRFEEAMREALPWIAERLGDGVTAAVSAPPASAPAPAPSA
jgi:23S rRNA (adenine2030-N6)-methyltransferase